MMSKATMDLRDKNIQDRLDFKVLNVSNEDKEIILYQFYKDVFNELTLHDQQIMIKTYTDLDPSIRYGENKWR